MTRRRALVEIMVGEAIIITGFFLFSWLWGWPQHSWEWLWVAAVWVAYPVWSYRIKRRRHGVL